MCHFNKESPEISIKPFVQTLMRRRIVYGTTMRTLNTGRSLHWVRPRPVILCCVMSRIVIQELIFVLNH